MPLEFVKSSRGKDKLVHDGFLHCSYRSHESKDMIRWRCENFRKETGSCKRRLVTVNGELTQVFDEHNHASDPTRVKRTKFANDVMARVLAEGNGTPTNIRQIITEELRTVSEPVRASVSLENIARNIRRHRHVDIKYPALPQRPEDLDIPQEYRQISSGGGLDFLLYDSGPAEQRTLIFATHPDVELLANSQVWAAFKMVKGPAGLFEVVYTIHAKVAGQYLPAVYILMSRGSEESYASAFEELVRRSPANLVPVSVYTDLDATAVNALQRVFGGVRVKVLFFHFTREVWRMIQERELTTRYGNDEDFASLLRTIPAVCFIPLEQVHHYFDTLAEALPDELEPVLGDFETVFVGRQRGSRRREPQFPPDLWNYYEEALGDELKAMAGVEMRSRSFASSVTSAGSNVWKLIDLLRAEQAASAARRATMAEGHTVSPKKKFVKFTAKIKCIVQCFEETEPLALLQSLANNFNF